MNIVSITSDKHHAHKIVSRKGYPHAAHMQSVDLVCTELAHAATAYPIVIGKHPQSGEFTCYALLGITERENLFYHYDGWLAHYTPMNIAREPFCVLTQTQAKGEAAYSMDEDSMYLSETQGDALFDQDGNDSEFLTRTKQALDSLYQHTQDTQQFLTTLEQLDLILPTEILFTCEHGPQHKLAGIYTIDEKRLRALDDAVVSRLFKKGHLGAIFAIINAIGQIQRLVEMKNRNTLQGQHITGINIRLGH